MADHHVRTTRFAAERRQFVAYSINLFIASCSIFELHHYSTGKVSKMSGRERRQENLYPNAVTTMPGA